MSKSWWLKFKRAQMHMVDIRIQARRYAQLHPYEFTRIRQPDSNHNIQFSVRITQQPDPVVSLMIGDFVHNLRSALDHVIFASVPAKHRSNATGFPFHYIDPFAKDADGEFVINNGAARKSFERSLRGLDPLARELVTLAQPYRSGDEADRWTLGIISRLDNADKHRALTVIGGGIQNPVAKVAVRNLSESLSHNLERYTFLKDGSTIGWRLPDEWRSADYPAPSEVQIQYIGTAVIHVKVTGVRGGKEPLSDYPLIFTMRSALSGVRRLLRALELFTTK